MCIRDSPNQDVDSGIFINQSLLVQEGVSTADGVVIDSFSSGSDAFAMSDDGTYVIFEAVRVDGVEGAYLIERSVGTNYCMSAPTSFSALGSVISAGGSAAISANNLELFCTAVVPGEPGLFYYGPTAVGGLPFGDGFRCVGGPMGTVVRVYPFVQADAGGVMHATIDNTIPVHSQLSPGATLYFQSWFRDTAGGPAGFNLSDGLEITFSP